MGIAVVKDIEDIELYEWGFPTFSPISIVVRRMKIIFITNDSRRYEDTTWTLRLRLFNIDLSTSISIVRESGG